MLPHLVAQVFRRPHVLVVPSAGSTAGSFALFADVLATRGTPVRLQRRRPGCQGLAWPRRRTTAQRASWPPNAPSNHDSGSRASGAIIIAHGFGAMS